VNVVSAESIQQAIGCGDYARALALWSGYTAALADGRLSETTLAEAAALVEWSRPILLQARAHAAERLRALHVAGVYSTQGLRTHALVRASL
jgi:hypothetical protein